MTHNIKTFRLHGFNNQYDTAVSTVTMKQMIWKIWQKGRMNSLFSVRGYWYAVSENELIRM